MLSRDPKKKKKHTGLIRFSTPPPHFLSLPLSSPSLYRRHHRLRWLQQDNSFTFILKTPPASVLLKKAAGVAKGSAQLEKVGSITKEQLEVRGPCASLFVDILFHN